MEVKIIPAVESLKTVNTTQPRARPQHDIEPGVLEVFRLFLVMRIGVTSVFDLLIAPSLLNLSNPSTLPGVVASIVLYGYLLSSRLRRLLGGWYLPLALVCAIILETLDQFSWIRTLVWDVLHVWGANPPDLLAVNKDLRLLAAFGAQAWQLSPPLFIIIIIVALQYRFVHVVLVSLLTFGIDLLLLQNLADAEGIMNTLAFTALVLRTGTFVLVGLVVTRQMNLQRLQKQELADANAKISRYANMVESLTISRERNRMARELHDTLAHTLSAASVQLEAVNSLWHDDPAKAHEVLQRSLSITRAGLKDTRRALQALRASPLEDLGLLLALRELAAVSEDRCGAAFTLVLPDKLDELPPEVEQVVYRVAQEALENIVRHAQAQHVRLTVSALADTLCLEIVDDGIGLDLAGIDAEGHFGIRGMRERVDMLNGSLDIESEPGRGARVMMKVRLTT